MIKQILLGLMLCFSCVVGATPVNVNTANAEALSASLKGIGVVKAQAIVAYRENHGLFQTIDDLAEVNGIGKVLIEKNKQDIKLQQ